MKILWWLLGGVVALILGFVVVERLAAERIEVVELHTLDEQGEEVVTRLWVVDYEGAPYLRVGGDGSGWYSRLTANETVRVTRNGETAVYQTKNRPDLSNTINQLMQEKYTWGDTFIGNVVGGRDGSIPIQLIADDNAS